LIETIFGKSQLQIDNIAVVSGSTPPYAVLLEAKPPNDQKPNPLYFIIIF